MQVGVVGSVQQSNPSPSSSMVRDRPKINHQVAIRSDDEIERRSRLVKAKRTKNNGIDFRGTWNLGITDWQYPVPKVIIKDECEMNASSDNNKSSTREIIYHKVNIVKDQHVENLMAFRFKDY